MEMNMENTEFIMQKGEGLIISIMQPTFIPWLGYFNLIRQSDTFVFLDSVQFEASSWQQRNKILIGDREVWLTVPTSRPNGRETLLHDVRVNYDHFDPKTVCETLRRSYGKKKGFDWIELELFPIFKENYSSLVHLNIELISIITKHLGLRTNFCKSSDLQTFGKKELLLESILLNFCDATYLSPIGAQVYLSKLGTSFPSGIRIEYQDYLHPSYDQGKRLFKSHMSIVDAIANVGIDQVKDFV